MVGDFRTVVGWAAGAGMSFFCINKVVFSEGTAFFGWIIGDTDGFVGGSGLLATAGGSGLLTVNIFSVSSSFMFSKETDDCALSWDTLTAGFDCFSGLVLGLVGVFPATPQKSHK